MSERVRVADWLMNALAERGVRHVFMVAGGGAMHLNDAAGLHPCLEVVATLHEQAAAIAVEAYAKVSGRVALCLVTAGPGGTNAITGVTGAWLDSTPMVVLSGQVKRPDLSGTTGVRQRGVQEVDITSIVRPVTKDAVLVTDPERIRHDFERAYSRAVSGRPGPVWLDVPIDVQAATVDPDCLEGFHPELLSSLEDQSLAARVEEVAAALRGARRPLLLVGAGVRLSGAEKAVLELVEALGVPVVSTWPAQGVVGDDHPLFVGRPGVLAPRSANFAVQSSDLLLCLGSRLSLVTTGYDPKDFARSARKFVVDIDVHELDKLAGAIEVGIEADVAAFVEQLLERAREEGSVPWHDLEGWVGRCQDWKRRYPVLLPEHRLPAERVSTYHFADVLSDLLAADDVLAPGCSGLAIEIFLLALRLHTGQRIIFNPALGAMGYGPPTAVGACLGSGGRRTICVDGDGGLQLNVQELETIRRLGLPIKLFILSNEGYASIRASQIRWFGRLVGADRESGMTLPELQPLAETYGLPYVRIDGRGDLRTQVEAVLERPGPVLCEVPTPPDEPRAPSQTSEQLPDGGMRSRPLEDLAPLLDRDELAANMAGAPREAP